MRYVADEIYKRTHFLTDGNILVFVADAKLQGFGMLQRHKHLHRTHDGIRPSALKPKDIPVYIPIIIRADATADPLSPH
jgi:hypothetical protein